jgi:fermentation-respiration switch protein FrsA (DUF1100 family)
MLTAVGVLVGAVTVLLAVVCLFQRRMIYFPQREAVPAAATALPGAEDIAFETADGLRLSGWFAKPATTTGGTVIVFNGNAGDRSHRAPLGAALLRSGLSVMLFDYRGYGRNLGAPSETGLVTDAHAARAYVVSRGDVDPDRLIYFGESLGSAVAVALAVEHAPRAVVLRSPFTSLTDVGRLHYPFLPVGLFLQDRFDTLGRIGDLECPVLVLAGDRDSVVPAEQSRRIYNAVQGVKRFVLIPGADHNDFDLVAGQRLVAEVTQFLQETLGGSVGWSR